MKASQRPPQHPPKPAPKPNPTPPAPKPSPPKQSPPPKSPDRGCALPNVILQVCNTSNIYTFPIQLQKSPAPNFSGI